MKALIIEDDHVFASTLMRRLTRYDYLCQHVDNGQQALLECRTFVPDVIILDMNLDKESGLQYIKMLKNLVPKVRIILLTGFASIATAVDAIKLGADDYLAKPIDTQTLLSALGDKKLGQEVSIQEEALSSERLEWEHIQQALKHNNGNVSATARQLSMHRRTLQRKLKKRPNFGLKS